MRECRFCPLSGLYPNPPCAKSRSNNGLKGTWQGKREREKLPGRPFHSKHRQALFMACCGQIRVLGHCPTCRQLSKTAALFLCCNAAGGIACRGKTGPAPKLQHTCCNIQTAPAHGRGRFLFPHHRCLPPPPRQAAPVSLAAKCLRAQGLSRRRLTGRGGFFTRCVPGPFAPSPSAPPLQQTVKSQPFGTLRQIDDTAIHKFVPL